MAGAVGTLVFCAHTDHIHLEFSKQHACVSHIHTDTENQNIFSPELETCSDFTLESTDSQNRTEYNLRVPATQEASADIFEFALSFYTFKEDFARIVPPDIKLPPKHLIINSPLII